jgi:alpha-galactosidase
MTRRVLGVVLVLVLGYAALAAGGCEPAVPPVGTPLPPTLAPTPPMGWNSWNTFGCDINETKIRQAAAAMARSGMAAAGYRYVVVDDCWYDPSRDADGNLRADPVRFPDGMKALADYVHSLGLKFGIYESPSTRTCAQVSGTYPGSTGSAGHERQDAATFAAWGVDYLKYDWCSTDATIADQVRAFQAMGAALRATGRPIVYSINANSHVPDQGDPPGQFRSWADIASMSRTTQDITATWDTGQDNAYPMGVRDIIAVNGTLAARAGPGHWNDPDMMVVGVSPPAGSAALTDTEQRTQFGMWAMMAAPLIAGNDLTVMSGETAAILTSRRVIAVDQDPLGRQAIMLRSGSVQVWARPLADGGMALALYHEDGASNAVISTGIGADLAAIGLSAARNYQVTDLWTGRTSTEGDIVSSTVAPHGVALLRVEPESGSR